MFKYKNYFSQHELEQYAEIGKGMCIICDLFLDKNATLLPLYKMKLA